MTNDIDQQPDPKDESPLAFPIGPGEPVTGADSHQEEEATRAPRSETADAGPAEFAYPIGPGEPVTGNRALSRHDSTSAMSSVSQAESPAESAYPIGPGQSVTDYDAQFASTELRPSPSPTSRRSPRLPWKWIALSMVLAILCSGGYVGWQQFGANLFPAPPIDDLSAVLAMSASDVENLDRTSPEFRTNHPLGRLYDQFRRDQLNGDDRRALMQWAVQTANSVKNPKIAAVLDDIAADELMVPASVLVVPGGDVPAAPAPNEPAPTPEETNRDSAGDSLSWFDELAAIATLLGPNRSTWTLTSWLQPELPAIPTDHAPPANLDARQREKWLLQAEAVKDADDRIRARAALNLARLCDLAKDPRKAGYERMANELATGKPLGANVARQLSDSNLKSSIDQLQQKLEQVRVAADNANQAANRQAQDAANAAANARKVADDATTKATLAGERADALAGLIAVAPEQLKDWLQETSVAIATLKADSLPESLPAQQRAALAGRVDVAKELQQQLEQLAELPQLTEQQSADVRRSLQRLQSQLIGLSADFAVARAATGAPTLWDRERLTQLLARLETWTNELSPTGISEAKRTELKTEVAALKTALADPSAEMARPGASLVTRLMQLMHTVTELRVASMYEQIASQESSSLDGAAEVWKELQLTAARIEQLKPIATSTSLDAAWQRMKQLAPRIDELLARRQALTDAERSQVVARVGQVSHIVSLLEATPLAVATPPIVPGGPGPRPPAVDLRPLQMAIAQMQRDLQTLSGIPAQLKQFDTRLSKQEVDRATDVAAIKGQLSNLQKTGQILTEDVAALESQMGAAQTQIGAVRTQVGSVQTQIGAVQADLRKLRDSPPQLTPEQIAALVRQSVDETFLEMAKRGYTPNSNGPTPPPITEPNPDLARVFAGGAFTEYFAGCPEQLNRAVDLFGKAVQYDPRSPTYRYFLGLTLFRLGRVTEAEAQIRVGREWERQRAALRVDRELIRVQGDLRQWLDRIRHGV